MAAKRQPDQQGTDDRNLQGPLQDSNQAEIARALRNVLFPLCMTELQSCFEPVIRRVVQEEVPSIIQRHLCNRTMLNQTERSGVRAFQLCFVNRLPPIIYTFSNLIAENGAPLEIALLDATSQYAIVTNGPLSSIKIEICPLESEFDSDEWTANEFNANIVKERNNKGPLLNGDKFVSLNNGIALIPKIVFTDNSSWIRSGKFRIGAKIVDSAQAINIREARSDPFRVMDNRGEPYKKHDYPSWNDPIWRLKKIAKGGKYHRHLSSHGIDTVKDLLHLQTSNPASFEQIFGIIPRKTRETIIEHAKACRDLDDMRSVYPTDGQPVVPERALSSSNDFMAIDELSPNSSMNSFATSLAAACNPDQGLQQFVAPQQETWGALSRPSTSTSCIGEAANNNQVQVWTDQQPDWIRTLLNSPREEYFPSGMHSAYPTAGSDTLFSSYNGSFFGSGDGAEFMHHSSSSSKFCGHDASSSRVNRKTLWLKIRSVLKWFRLYAAKRNQVNPFSIPHK